MGVLMLHKLSDYFRFYKLARKRLRSKQDNFKFQTHQAGMVIDFLESKEISFKNLRLLDIGTGEGGYSSEFVKRGAKVTGIDITDKYFQRTEGVNFLLGDASRLPFRDSSFDFVCCSSMIEHIKNQEGVVKEISRILKKDGFCYLSFPPFWSPVGSHQFKPFHYLGERCAIKLSRKFYNVSSFRYDDKYGKLYKTTIMEIKRLIKKTDLNIKSTTTRFLPINFAKIPILNEFLTWHVEFLLQK